MALAQLALRIAGRAVDDASALHRRAFGNLVGPAVDVLVACDVEEFAELKRAAARDLRHPFAALRDGLRRD